MFSIGTAHSSALLSKVPAPAAGSDKRNFWADTLVMDWHPTQKSTMFDCELIFFCEIKSPLKVSQ